MGELLQFFKYQTSGKQCERIVLKDYLHAMQIVKVYRIGYNGNQSP